MWRWFQYPTVNIAETREIYRDTVHMCHRLVEEYQLNGVNRVDIPSYPSEEERSTNSMDELDMMLTLCGRSKVYRNGWVNIGLIHVLSYPELGIRCTCDDFSCVYCLECIARLTNAHSGEYDCLGEQIAGFFDRLQDQEAFERYIDVPPVTAEMERFNAEEVDRLVLMLYGHGVNYDLPDDNDDDTVYVVFGEPIVEPPVPPTSSVGIIFSEEYCSLCMDETDLSLVMSLSCGHKFHHDCFYQLQSATCPVCRTPYDIMQAESGIVSTIFDFKVEYAATETLGQMEFDDPVWWLDCPQRVGKYQVYILTGENQGTLRVNGDILQVRTLSDESIVSRCCGSYEWRDSGSFELEVIATAPISCEMEVSSTVSTVVEDSVIPSGSKVLLFGQGTFGDVQPLILIRDELVSRGYTARLVAPSKFTSAEYHYDWAEVEEVYRKSPTVVPSVEVLMKLPCFRKFYVQFEGILREYQPDFVVSSLKMLGMAYLCDQYNVPMVAVSAIPRGVGAHTYMEQNSPWSRWMAEMLENVLEASCDLLISGFDASFGAGRFDDFDDPPLLCLAPLEVSCGQGVGGLRASEPTGQEYKQYDIFFSLGSMIDPSIEDYYLALFAWTKYKVLFQSTRYTKVYRNVTFIAQCNHEDIMRDVPVVVCHGGSGTVQTALSYGCHVLVHPFWVDQKYWYSVLPQFGYDIAKCLRDRQFIQQLSGIVGKPRNGKLMERATIQAVVNRLLAIVPRYKPRLVEGDVFVFATQLEDRRFAAIGRLEWLATRCVKSEHVGIGRVGPDNWVSYMELQTDGTGGDMHVQYSGSRGISPIIVHTCKVNVPYNEQVFKTLMPVEFHGLNDNCRTQVDRYLAHYSSSVCLDDIVHSPAFSRISREVGGFMHALHRGQALYDPGQDGWGGVCLSMAYAVGADCVDTQQFIDKCGYHTECAPTPAMFKALAVKMSSQVVVIREGEGASSYNDEAPAMLVFHQRGRRYHVGVSRA